MTKKSVDLSSKLGLITVSGPDAEKFLQGQLTQDIRQITEDELKLAAFCNLKGRVLSLFGIFKKNDVIFLQCPKEIITDTIADLKKFARFSKVTLQDKSNEYAMIGIIGTIGIEINNEYPIKITEGSEDKIQYLKVNGKMPRMEIIGPVSDLFVDPANKSQDDEGSKSSDNKSSETKLRNTPTQISHYDTWTLMNIRSEIPEVRLETRGTFLVHHLNLPELGAVSFNKGCYVGQEIVARMEYRGNIKRQMVHRILSEYKEVPKPGTEISITENEEVEQHGTIVSAVLNEKKEVEALILIT
jgi:tRNA-modifying protein YgfZ